MINQNIDLVRKKIAQACKKVKKDPKDIILVAVTKTVPLDMINEAIASGISEIGESKLQEVLTKIDKLPKNIKKHFIGHLQSNKTRKTVEIFDLIQSVDSLGLIEDINRHSLNAGKVQDCLLELKVSKEATKFGLKRQEIENILKSVDKFKNIRVCGLMAMAPYFDDPEVSRPYFKEAKDVFEGIKKNFDIPGFKILSMGMSHDFEAAIEEGSNMVRIGTAIFGERNYE